MRALLLLILFSGCELSLDIDVPQADRVLIIDAPFEVGQPWRVGVGHSMAVQQGRLQDHDTAVFGATVEIYEGDTLVERLVQDRDPIYPPRPVLAPATTSTQNYRGHTTPIAGRTYTLVVRHPDFPEARATSSTPVPLDSARFVGSATRDGRQFSGRLEVDDDASASHYAVHLTQQPGGDPEQSDVTGLFFTSPTTIFERPLPNPFNDIDESVFTAAFFADDAFENAHYPLDFDVGFYNDQGLYCGDNPSPTCTAFGIYANVHAITPEYFAYVRSLIGYEGLDADDNPLGEPIRLVGNVEGGIGLFAGRSAPILVELAERP